MASKASFILGALLLSAVQVQAKSNIDEFTVNCHPLTTQRSDPIKTPGRPAGHVHVITGGNAFQRTMGDGTVLEATGTTCDKEIDLSNYWVPAMYHKNTDGTFEMVEFLGNAVYYMNRACSYQAGLESCDKTVFADPPPKGLRMIAGDSERRTFNKDDITNRATSHMCMTDTTSKETNLLPDQHCLKTRSQVTFPPCWDGVNLDSDDHKSHMAYPAKGDYNGGVCPESHPVAILQVFFEFFFNTGAYPDWDNFVYSQGDDTGAGLHGDFINGWTDLEALGRAIETCTDDQGVNDPNCSLRVNGQSPGSSGPQDLLVPAVYEEDIGLDGPIAALPGVGDDDTGSGYKVNGTMPARRSRFSRTRRS